MFLHGLDWLAFGVSDVHLPVFDSIPCLERSSSGGPFHCDGLEAPGLKVFFNTKAGCKNPQMQVEMRGEFFRKAPGLGEAIFNQLGALGFTVSPYRIDYKIDIMSQVGDLAPAMFPEQFMPLPQKNGIQRHAAYYYDEMGNWSGLKMGKADVVIRVYDKILEQAGKEGGLDTDWLWDWWRVEVQLRGDVLKAHLQDPVWVDRGLMVFAAKYGQKALLERLRVPPWLGQICQDAESTNWTVLPREKNIENRIAWRLSKMQKLMEEVDLLRVSCEP